MPNATLTLATPVDHARGVGPARAEALKALNLPTLGDLLTHYPRESLPLIRRYVDEGNNADQPGRLVEWLYPQTPFYTWRVPGTWFDIGSAETLAEADAAFSAAGSA